MNRVMSHIWLRHTYERVTSRTRQRVTAQFWLMWQVESSLKHGWNRALGISSTTTRSTTNRKDKPPDAVCVTRLISMRDVIRSYVIHSYVYRDSFTHMCTVTHSLICVPWLIHTWRSKIILDRTPMRILSKPKKTSQAAFLRKSVKKQILAYSS